MKRLMLAETSRDGKCVTSTFVTNLNGRNGNCYNAKDQKMVVYEVLQSFYTTLVKKNNNSS